MKIAGIVTLYKQEEDVLKNIDSYINSIDKLYIVDDNSDDSFKNKINNSKIEYIPNYKNIGVATALNIGANKAIKEGYKWLLTMDQDSSFENSNDVSKMIEYIEKIDTSKVGLVTPWHVINTGVKKQSEEVDNPFEVMTSGNIINLDAYLEIGGFKDIYFIDDIDIEYCMNLNKHGYRIDRLNYIELKHDLGDIEVKHFLNRDFVCSNHNYIRRYYMVRNTFYLCDSYKDIYPDYCSFLKRGLRGQLQNIILFEKDKFRKIRNMYRGYKDYRKKKVGMYPYK